MAVLAWIMGYGEQYRWLHLVLARASALFSAYGYLHPTYVKAMRSGGSDSHEAIWARVGNMGQRCSLQTCSRLVLINR
jgi:hypothetical protein